MQHEPIGREKLADEEGGQIARGGSRDLLQRNDLSQFERQDAVEHALGKSSKGHANGDDP